MVLELPGSKRSRSNKKKEAGQVVQPHALNLRNLLILRSNRTGQFRQFKNCGHNLGTVSVGFARVKARARSFIPKPSDGYQAFLDSIGHKIHSIVLRQGKPMRHVVIEPELTSLDETNFYRLVRVYLEGQVEPHAWFERMTY